MFKVSRKSVFTVVALMALLALGVAVGSAQETTVITFWKHSHPPADAFTEQIVAEYEAANPGIDIQMEIIPHDQYISRVLAAAAGGQLPDLFDINDANLAVFIDRGIIAPVDPQAFGFENQAELEGEYVVDSLNAFKGSDGQIYGMPFEYNSWVMVINTEMFDEAGIEYPVDGWTWEELAEIAGRLAVVENGVFQRQGFSWNLITPGWTMLQVSPLIYQLGGSILTEDDLGDQCALNTPEGVQALQFMQDMFSVYGAGAPGINLATGQDAMVDFVEERVAIWFIGPWTIPALTASENVGDNFMVVPFPRFADAEREVVMLSAWLWTVNNNSAVTSEAWSFVDYAQQQGDRWLETSGYILPRLGWTDTEVAANFPGLETFISEMSYGRPRLIHPNAGEIGTLIHQAVQEVVLNGVSAQEAFDNACQEIDSILQG